MADTKNKGVVTCVSVSKDTRDKLAKLGKKDQTFEEIILSLLPKERENGEEEDSNVE